MVTEGMEVSSVGNTLLLHETALVEACNLKAAIEYNLKNCKTFNCKRLFVKLIISMHCATLIFFDTTLIF